MRDRLRQIRLKTAEHRYTLNTYYTGSSILEYELKQDGKILFSGRDFKCSPLHCVDSDESCHALLDFLSLRPGDTDEEYFANYTPEQMEFAEGDAEYLQWEIETRFERES